jgi:hypothetical protein
MDGRRVGGFCWLKVAFTKQDVPTATLCGPRQVSTRTNGLWEVSEDDLAHYSPVCNSRYSKK